MTKKEKALKYLSAMRVIDFNKLGFVYGKETITDILNLIQSQQEEIKELNLDKDILVNVANKYIEELEKKDKIINEMEKYFISGLSMCEECEKCFESEDIYKCCEECLKQYFEKKVEGKQC